LDSVQSASFYIYCQLHQLHLHIHVIMDSTPALHLKCGFPITCQNLKSLQKKVCKALQIFL
jgi:hypothetical protein